MDELRSRSSGESRSSGWSRMGAAAWSLPAYSRGQQPGSTAEGEEREGVLEGSDGAERYERVSLLGQGGMGRVWAGYDRRLQRPVALKQPTGGWTSPAAALLQREAAITAQLNHPSIVHVYDVVVDHEGPTFVMQQVVGVTLRQALAGAPARTGRRRWVRPLVTACHAVGHAHQSGVVHGDLSPNNIMLGDDAEVWVIDWGLARHESESSGLQGRVGAGVTSGGGPAIDAEPTSLTGGMGEAAGTPGFVAPEVRAGAPARRQSDVWALGSLLHFVVTGRPFTDSTVISAGSDPLMAIVARATRRDPAQRYADARELAMDLERWLDGRLVQAHELPFWRLSLFLLHRWRWQVTALGVLFATVAGALVFAARESDRARRLAEESSARADEARVQAEAQEAAVERALAQQLAARAVQAVDGGHGASALKLAEEALEHAPNPAARGVLALANALPAASLDGAMDVGWCRVWLPLPEWGDGLCSQPYGLQLWRGGRPVWTTWSELAEIRLGPWPIGPDPAAMAVHVVHGPGEYEVLDLRDGRRVFWHPEGVGTTDAWGSTVALRSTQQLVRWPHVAGDCEGFIEVALPLSDGRVFISCGTDGGTIVAADGTRQHWPFFAGAGIQGAVELPDGEVWVSSKEGHLAPLAADRRGLDLGEPIRAMFVLSGTEWLVVQSEAGTVRLVDPRAQEVVLTLPGRQFMVYEGEPDARTGMPTLHTVAGGLARRYVLPSPLTRAAARLTHGFSSVVMRGDVGAYASDGGGAVVWVPRDRSQPVQRLPYLAGVVKSLALAPDERRIMAGGIRSEGTDEFGVMDLTLSAPRRIRRDFTSLRRLAWTTDDELLVLDYANGVVVSRPDGTESRRILAESGFSFHDMHLARSGSCVVLVGPVVVRGCGPADAPVGSGMEAWRWQGVRESGWIAGAVNSAGDVALVSEGRARVLTASDPAWEPVDVDGRFANAAGLAPTPTELRGLDSDWALESPATDVIWARDTDVVTGTLDGTVTIWRVGESEPWATWRAHQAQVGALDVSADGEWLVSAGWDGRVQFARLGLDASPTGEPE